MKISNEIRRLLAVLFAVLYFFVFSFSQYFHHHRGFYENIKGKADFSCKFEKATSSNSIDADCLSCHFLAGGHSILNKFSGIELTIFQSFNEQKFHDSLVEVNSYNSPNFLRGPPKSVFV